MIKNIVFDIGNVLAKFNWREFFASFDLDEDIYERVAKATVLDDDWNEFDRGVLSSEEVIELLAENDPEIGDIIRKVLSNINGMIKQFDYSVDWIKELQGEGYKVYCLSNMSFKACEDCGEAMNFLPILDGYVLSCDVKQIKPDREIYETLLNKYDLKPEETVFFDDLEKNIQAAKEVGIHGIVFTAKEEAVEKLEVLVRENEGKQIV